MLSVLADTFRIATFQGPVPKPPHRSGSREQERKRRGWHWIAGMHL
ncbi:hypothetical protein [Defluviimonas sp. SAOS-178_SWC]